MGWLDWLGKRNAADDPRLPEAIERAIYKVEPRLKQSSAYTRRYRTVIAAALKYADGLAAAIPGPVALDREHYVRDPYLHALFASADEIQHTLRLSRAVRDYQQHAASGEGELYALMGMRRRESQSFGMETEGETVRREVAQQTITFSDHTLSCIAPSEHDTRALLAWSLFDSLISHVANHLENLRRNKTLLEQRRDEHMARLRGKRGSERTQLETELRTLLDELGESSQKLSFDHLPGYFTELLRQPETRVHLEQQTFRLDGMGIQRTQTHAAPSHPIAFTDLRSSDRRRWTVTLVRCHHQQLPPIAELLEDANRWLAI